MSEKFSFDWSALRNKIQDEEKNKGGKKFEADKRFWKATVDSEKKASAVIRFIPDQNMNPFIKYYTHNFNYMLNGTKKYYIKNCINSFGYEEECPVCKKNMEYYASVFEEDKKIASARKRKLIFVSNILVIKDPANPENEGKIFLFQYGQKIYNKIKDKMFPSDEIKALGEYDEYVPFDLYEGANFKFIQVPQGEFPNYDLSEFGKQGKVGDEKRIKEIMEKVYDLTEFTNRDKFPTNEEVIKMVGPLLGLSNTDKPVSQEKPKESEVTDDDIPDFSSSIEDITSDPLVEDDKKEAVDDDDDWINQLTK